MAEFRTIHTTYGLQRIASAEASGTPINLTHMAVGDGNGNPVTPAENQTALVREMYRSTVNRVFQDGDEPTKFTAELIVPADEGGFTLREVGVFDADGGLFAVGNLPDTYKPDSGEGAFADTIVRVEFRVTNADVITVIVDPAVAVASQQWVTNAVTVCSLMPGGTTGQILRKASNGCGDVEWADPTDANVVVNVIEEEQTLAAGQVNVDLVETNVVGLAVYIEGVRLPKKAGATGWQPHATIETRVVLGQAYPAGSKLIAVQNEPASDLIDALDQAQNLADVPNKATARTNLDVYSKAETDQKAPAGLVAYFARSTAPSGWLKCNGAIVSQAVYATLYAAIGNTFNTGGEGVGNFRLPDLRGEFLRGWDDGRGVDAGRTLGSYQADAFKAHSHNVYRTGGADQSTNANGSVASSGDSYATSSTGGTETRPRNRALLACIKF